jgi:hypothetical protein
LSATGPNSRSAQLHSGAWPTCTVRARPTATRAHGPQPRWARPVFTVLARPVCAARARPMAMRGAVQLGLDRCSTRHERVRRRTAAQRAAVARHALLRRRPHRRTGDGREGVAGLNGAWTAARDDSASVDVGGGGTAARWRPTGTREKISVDVGVRNAAARPHSPAHGGVDSGVNGFGHGGDGSDRAMAASDSGGRDGEAKRHVRAAARVGTFRQRRGTARRAVRSGSGCRNGF